MKLARIPSAEKQQADAQTERLAEARKERRSALADLMAKLRDIPIEEGMAKIGEDLTRGRK